MSNDDSNNIEEVLSASDRLGLIMRELSRVGITTEQASRHIRAAFLNTGNQIQNLSRIAPTVSQAVVVPEGYRGGLVDAMRRGVIDRGAFPANSMSYSLTTTSSSSTSSSHGFHVGRHELPEQGKKFYDKLCKSSKWQESSSLFFKTGSRFICKDRPSIFVELFPARYIGGWYSEGTDTLEWIYSYLYSKNIYALLGYWLTHSSRRQKESNLPLAMDEVASDNFVEALEEVIEKGEDVLHLAFYTRAVIRREPKEVVKKVRYIRV